MLSTKSLILVKMGKKSSCTPDIRKIILNLKNQGTTISEIAKNIGRSRKMVRNAINYQEKYKTCEAVQRKKRPKKTTGMEDRIITNYARKNPFIRSSEIKKNLSEEHGVTVSTKTIRRRLNENRLIGCIAQHKPLVSNKNIKARLNFAKQYKNKSISFWKNVFWSDESKFNQFGSDGKKNVWRPSKQEFNPRYTLKTIKHGGGSIMVWGAFSWHGVGPIVKIVGKMDQHQYRQILEQSMIPYAEEKLPIQWVFMHDNDPKHTARTVKNFLVEESVDLLPWPAQSPDLNPIENLWNDVEAGVRLKNPKNLLELWEAIQSSWNSIPSSRCKALVESVPRRLEAVIKQKGYPTKY